MKENILKYGRAENLPLKKVLRAGKLSMVYQDGFLRYIKCGNHEIIRMINHAIRDENWGTYTFDIENEIIKANADSFQISYDAVIKEKEVDFTWKCSIKGASDSALVFEIRGMAARTFYKNRAGFTVLHPLKECAGKPIIIIQPDGSELSGEFPPLIAPDQPFKNISGMRWHVSEEIVAMLRFEGDVFEMEDQRNWMDASFKTYCTPLELPFPAKLEKGDEVIQRIALKVDAKNERSSTEDQVKISLSDKRSKLPAIGVCQSTEVNQLTQKQINKIASLGLDHYRIDLHLSDLNWKVKLEDAAKEVADVNIKIELALFVNEENTDLTAIELNPWIVDQIHTVILFSEREKTISDALIAKVIDDARKIFPKAEIGAGTDAFFTELNRARIHSDQVDFLSFSTNPQVHASDNESLIETLEAIPSIIDTAKSFAGNKSIHISPITFKMRWNPNATKQPAPDPKGVIPWNADVRQMSYFGAVWSLGALKQLAESGVESVTFYECVGMKGFMPGDETSQHPFNVVNPFPVFELWEEILKFKDFPVVPCTSTQPLRCEALGFDIKGKTLLFLANYTNERLPVHFPHEIDEKKITYINYKGTESFKRFNTLDPYQIVRFEVM